MTSNGDAPVSHVPRAGWRSELAARLTGSASRIDDFLDARIRRLRRRLGREGVPAIQPYIGYAAAGTLRLHGRVLTNAVPPLADDPETWWRSLGAAVRRFASDEVPGVTVEARLAGASCRADTDSEGYFRMSVPYDAQDEYWLRIPLALMGHAGVTPDASTVLSRNISVPSDATYLVVSDIDDTVLHTGATRWVEAARNTFLAGARTRAPLAGVGTLYQLLHRGGDLAGRERNPVFYVSSSPWNLFDLLEDFLELNHIPLGPLLLRDIGFDADAFLTAGHGHKLEKIRTLLAATDPLPCILIGDSGQEDARIYAEAAAEFGSRIRCVVLRDVDPGEVSPGDAAVAKWAEAIQAAGVPVAVAEDSVQAAEGLVSAGLLPPDRIDVVRRAVELDVRRGMRGP